MVVEATQKKLRQARFSLSHMRAEANKAVRDNPEAFDHYLGAFLSAARSVPWVLGCEESDKWKAWEPKWRTNLTDEERSLLAFTNEQRIAEEKQRGPLTTFGHKVIPYFTVILSKHG